VGVSLDGTAFRYDNPLQVRGGYRSPAAEIGLRRSEWFELACCPPNVMRLLASLGHYVATRSASDDLTIHQYAAGVVDWPGGGRLLVDTDYPWSGDVTIHYTGPQREGVLRLRIPAWVDEAELTVDGTAAAAAAGGYVRVERSWSDGDEVTLRLGLAVRLTEAHPRVDALRGCVAVERGPVVYCLEQTDHDVPIDDLRVPVPGGPSTVEWSPLLQAPVVTFPAEVVDLTAWTGQLYRDAGGSRPDPRRPALCRTIPYFAWSNRMIGAMRVWIPR